VKILGCSFDTVEENRAFAEKFGWDFPLLCDTDRAIGMAYGACDVPTRATPRRISFLIGADGRIEQVHLKVNAAAHPAELLASL